ncbi:MAG: glycoside hydrolase family 43 protein [Paenibacillus sp.]|nr:glycoside hydrolase family 43 protein [Paenibacillus sp.]
MRKTFLAMLGVTALAVCHAQTDNASRQYEGATDGMPVVQTEYTADPAPLVVGDTVYLYTTHDEDGADGFDMRDWLLYTSTDMVNWTNHGAVASLQDFKWRSRDNGAWAEQVVYRNGKYYMYCPLHGHGIGVLVSDTPYGPFVDPIGKPLVWQKEHWYDIDPTVLVDDDGQAYMYWGNPKLYHVKLNEDMISCDGPIVEHPHIQDYQEGPWIWKRGGKYYLAFASTCCPEGIGYAMSDSPVGPWQYKGHIMDHTDRTRGNHPGIIEYKGRDYVFGLNYDVLRLTTRDHHERRSVSVAPMYYKEDGTILESPYFKDTYIKPVGTFNPYRRVEAETMAWGYGLKTSLLSKAGAPDGGYRNNLAVCDIDPGETLLLKNVDFRDGASKFIASVASPKGGAVIEIHIDSADGPVIGTCKVPSTGGDDRFKTISCKLRKAEGIHDLVFKFTGSGSDLFRWDWWRME